MGKKEAKAKQGPKAQGRPAERKLSAAEKKKRQRAQAAKTTAATLAAFFAVSAGFFLLREYEFPPQEADAASEGPSAVAIGEDAAGAPIVDAAANAKSSYIIEENSGPKEPEAAGEPSADVALAPAEELFPALPSSSLEVPKGEGVLCFVFDDAGHNLFHLEPFLELSFPCTIAVLPSLAHSAEAAEKIRGSGKELILHQPMQAINLSVDPGPGAVLPGMTAEEIRDVVNANLDEIWPVSGLNNHEGSLITGDAASMEAVLDVVEERSIFFLDSKTIAKTASRGIAAERGMRILERAVFLDNSPERDAILAEVLNGVRSAARNGFAIMIGHVWSPQLAQILAELYPTLTDAGYRIEDLSALLASIKEKEDEAASYSAQARQEGERG